MEEVGVSLSGQWSKDVSEYMGKKHFGYLITVCSNAEERCPATFPGISHRLHWSFEDPAAFEGSDDDTLRKFREIRDQIERRVQAWVKEQATAAAK
jgi:arsenate reductase